MPFGGWAEYRGIIARIISRQRYIRWVSRRCLPTPIRPWRTIMVLSVPRFSRTAPMRTGMLNSDIFGLRKRDIELAALVARYHRRATPKASHADYTLLPRGDRITVSLERLPVTAVKGVMPVSHIDGNPIGAGRPGAVTQRLAAAYDAVLSAN